ncbi:MAG TPA: hypothetical protein VKI19_11865 [Acidimicrobiales bacterium]|nr:hypothetical protein [Acidimicrobiales bacterium]
MSPFVHWNWKDVSALDAIACSTMHWNPWDREGFPVLSSAAPSAI